MNVLSIMLDVYKERNSTIYLFKVNNRNTTVWCEMCSKLAIKVPEWRH